jgi:hypothetical protein
MSEADTPVCEARRNRIARRRKRRWLPGGARYPSGTTNDRRRDPPEKTRAAIPPPSTTDEWAGTCIARRRRPVGPDSKPAEPRPRPDRRNGVGTPDPSPPCTDHRLSPFARPQTPPVTISREFAAH